MNKLSEIVRNLIEKWNGKSRNYKIAVSLIGFAIIGALIYAAMFLNTTKYGVLFNNMDSADSKAVMAKLDEKKIAYQAKSGSILVPLDQVDKLRLELAPDLTNGSKGWELFEQSKFAPTDREMDITYQRALEGELERTIKGFSEIENVKVHLVLQESSVFVKDTTPAKASVTLKIKQGYKINPDQVKAIISLVSGSVKNLPKENVEVIDDKMQLLSKDIFNKDKSLESTTSTEKQQDIKGNFEKSLEANLNEMLLGVFGKDKVKVKVNADLNFDATEQSSIVFDPKSVVRSQQTIRDLTGSGQGNTAQSPVDNNMNNTTTAQNNGTTVSHEDVTINNEISKVENKTIKAPGEIKRLTTSVVINDANLNAATKAAIVSLVGGAIGYDVKRGDSISVEGIAFQKAEASVAQQELDEMQKAADLAKKMALYKNIGIGSGALLLLLLMLILRRKPKQKQKKEQVELAGGLDILIDDEIEPKEEIQFEAINFEVNNEKTHLEKEIKNYATTKPEQVVDIIKTWLAEDERG